MESKRFFLAIALSMIILFGFQYFAPAPPVTEVTEPLAPTPAAITPENRQAESSQANPSFQMPPSDSANIAGSRQGRDIPVETSLYSAIVQENGGGLKSFKLKKYLESKEQDAPLQQLVGEVTGQELPLSFTWGEEPEKVAPLTYTADQQEVSTGREGEISLTLMAADASGLQIAKTMTFSDQNYLIDLKVKVYNPTEQPIQGRPHLSMTNQPFGKIAQNSFLFSGPALFRAGVLEEIKPKDLEKSEQTFEGLTWTAYEGTYFMYAIIPRQQEKITVRYSLKREDTVSTLVSGEAAIIPPQGSAEYAFTIYVGPKKLADLTAANSDLDKIVNFGWFDLVAKPVLHLLNFIYGYIHNYGIAIILVTFTIKMLFWPIAQKGMKSMKTMQKLQPKMAKLREKYKDNREQLNLEMINLYKTYKVNPVGGCLPMFLQIPVFFALYKVLLQTIELRHAPFMLWITDLSAPDRLSIGFDLPYLHGIPVLTLLMGASMFVQQRMSPPPADPTQAKVMLFLPVIFTFMFLNFASGLVLYWFVNNLLSIAQQYLINRQMDARTE